MPIYEYACQACGHTMDQLQKISDEPLVDCPQCGQPQLKKLVSAPSFKLTGSGWYETDFKGDKKSEAKKSSSSSSSSDTSASSASTSGSASSSGADSGSNSSASSSASTSE